MKVAASTGPIFSEKRLKKVDSVMGWGAFSHSELSKLGAKSAMQPAVKLMDVTLMGWNEI